MDPELEASIDHDAELMDSFVDGNDYDPTPWTPPDERWDTTRYHLMVYLGEKPLTPSRPSPDP